MTKERRPLRQLSQVDRLLVRVGRCPTCRKKLASVPHDQTASWTNIPAGLGKAVNSATSLPFSHTKMGHVTQFHHGKIPHCPECQHTFVHGWIYPAMPE